MLTNSLNKPSRSPAAARKADCTAYKAQCSCRMLNNKNAEMCTPGIAMITKLPMAISDVQILAVWLFTVFSSYSSDNVYRSKGGEFEEMWSV